MTVRGAEFPVGSGTLPATKAASWPYARCSCHGKEPEGGGAHGAGQVGPPEGLPASAASRPSRSGWGVFRGAAVPWTRHKGSTRRRIVAGRGGGGQGRRGGRRGAGKDLRSMGGRDVSRRKAKIGPARAQTMGGPMPQPAGGRCFKRGLYGPKSCWLARRALTPDAIGSDFCDPRGRGQRPVAGSPGARVDGDRRRPNYFT